jgi:hypothetical protein
MTIGFGLILSQAVLAADAPLTEIPGLIPLKFGERNCAGDLIYKGKRLLPDEACKLVVDGQKAYEASGTKVDVEITGGYSIKNGNPNLRFDLSRLDPDATSTFWRPPHEDGAADIRGWKPGPVGNGYYDDLKAMDIKDDGETVDYQSGTEVLLGRYAIVVQKRAANGSIHAYRLRMDLKGHNILMRKTLLRKLGYQIPLMDRLKTVKVRFANITDKLTFLKELRNRTLVPASRWVTEGGWTNGEEKETSGDNTVTLQDVIVMDAAQDPALNPATGVIDPTKIQGSRAFNSLLLPFSITDAPESINLMSWTQGGIEFNGQLVMSYEFADPLKPSYEDARWMARRMLALTKRDWQEVVASGKIPRAAGLLMVEKLISRRNYIRETLNLAKESNHIDALAETSQTLPVDLGISDPPLLVNGKLIGDKWPGYARDFGGTDPDSPWSTPEILAYTKSVGFSTMIMNLVAEFNDRYAPATNLAKAEADRALDLAVEQFGHFLETKEIKDIPRNIWSKKYYAVHAFAHRDTVAGNYLGTQNQIQVADGIDLSAEAGWHLKGEGLPAKMGLTGKARLAAMKSYTHVKPLLSIQEGNKQPFRNIIVPYLISQQKRPLDNILLLEPPANQPLSADQKAALQAKIKKQMAGFDELFGKGESVIVTTSYGPDFSLIISKGLSGDAAAYAKARDRFVDVKRLHIYRKDQNTVHVYFDPSKYNEFSLGAGINMKIPIVTFDWSLRNGVATTNYFEFNIDPDLEKNPQFFDNMTYVSAALKEASLDFFKSVKKPWIFKHKFNDQSTDLSLLMLRYKKAQSGDKIQMTTPQGITKSYVRNQKGYRTGKDYQTLLTQLTAAWVREKLDPNFQMDTASSGDPADTVNGSSTARQVTIEAEGTPNGLRRDNMLANIRYTWRGWSSDAKGTNEVLDEVQNMYQSDLFKRPDLHDTKKIRFYNLTLNVALYREAIDYMMSLPDEAIQTIFKEHYKDIYRPRNPTDGSDVAFSTYDPWANSVIIARNAIRKNWVKDQAKVSEELAHLFYVAESQLTFNGFKKLVGGQQNIFIRGTLDGFREGDQKGKYALGSTSLGIIGSQEPLGPLATIQGFNNISSGELFISWLLSNL